MKNKKQGLLIAVEGIDGSGKSSLCNGLEKALSIVMPVLLTKEPGGTALGKKLRTLLHDKEVPLCSKAEFLLFASDRAQHFEELVLPTLESGTTVISDRMADSSLVYQGYGRGLDVTLLKTINAWAMCNHTPDIIFYLKISPELAYQRIAQRNLPLTSFEKEVTFMHSLAAGFDALFETQKNVVFLDATQSNEILVQEAVAIIQTMHKERA